MSDLMVQIHVSEGGCMRVIREGGYMKHGWREEEQGRP